MYTPASREKVSRTSANGNHDANFQINFTFQRQTVLSPVETPRDTVLNLILGFLPQKHDTLQQFVTSLHGFSGRDVPRGISSSWFCHSALEMLARIRLSLKLGINSIVRSSSFHKWIEMDDSCVQ
jgi:hypothetical protein